MSDDLTKKAAEMLLQGATLLGEPCPYCKGVRVIRDGDAFCVICGKGPVERPVGDNTVTSLEKRLESLVADLGREQDRGKHLEILESIRSLTDELAGRSTEDGRNQRLRD